jgi:hypothetical protein
MRGLLSSLVGQAFQPDLVHAVRLESLTYEVYEVVGGSG